MRSTLPELNFDFLYLAIGEQIANLNRFRYFILIVMPGV
jgi:hypothetical protein